MAQIVYQPFSFNSGVKNVFSEDAPLSQKVFYLWYFMSVFIILVFVFIMLYEP